jgi:hypothetical protein
VCAMPDANAGPVRSRCSNRLISDSSAARPAPSAGSAVSAKRGGSQKLGCDPNDEEFTQAIARVCRTYSNSRRDFARMCVRLSTRLRPWEVVRLKVADDLASDDSVRSLSVLRCEATIGGARPPLFADRVT